MSNYERVYKMRVSKVYPLYISKVERKGHTKAEVDTVTEIAPESPYRACPALAVG